MWQSTPGRREPGSGKVARRSPQERGGGRPGGPPTPGYRILHCLKQSSAVLNTNEMFFTSKSKIFLPDVSLLRST